MGIEPTLLAWEANALPLSYTRICFLKISQFLRFVKNYLTPTGEPLALRPQTCYNL